jgi:hypothetical protein
MISPIDRFTSLPYVSQAVAISPTNTYDFPVVAGTNFVIRDVPSIHAHSVTIFVAPTGTAVTNVTIRKYAANRTITQDAIAIAGPVAAGATASVDNVGTIGETYDILLTAAGAGTVKVWTAARST